MTFQVQRIGDSYGVLFTEEQMHQAGLHEGTEIELKLSGSAPRYISLDTGMRAYKQTEPQWAAAYEELAK